jgi:hypothetical protein
MTSAATEERGLATDTSDLRIRLADREGPKPDASGADAAWLVLEAASDLGDELAITACRRVIDANLNGRPADPSDLHFVLNYFR